MRDKLNVMPFPAGEMRYRMGWNGKGRYIKCFCQQFSFLIEKRIKTKGLQVEGEDTGVHGCDGMSACEGGGEGGGVGGGGEKQRCWWGGREWWLGVFVIKKTKTKKPKEKQTDWSQPRMRLDLPPGGFLRPPEAALAPPDGSEGCGTSFCCWSCSSCWSCTSSGYSTAKKRGGIMCYCADHNNGWCGSYFVLQFFQMLQFGVDLKLTAALQSKIWTTVSNLRQTMEQ